MDQKQKEALNLVAELLSGSMLEMVIKAMLSSDNPQINNTPVSQKETIIGELSLFEKSVAQVCQKITEDHNVFVAEFESMMFVNRAVDESGIEKVLQKTKRLAAAVTTLKNLLWASIRFRLSGQDVDNLEQIGIRSENKIVRINDAEIEEEELQSIFESLFSSMREDHHDCSNCPAYEGCDLPFKQATARG
jgi:hypothetical protein